MQGSVEILLVALPDWQLGSCEDLTSLSKHFGLFVSYTDLIDGRFFVCCQLKVSLSVDSRGQLDVLSIISQLTVQRNRFFASLALNICQFWLKVRPFKCNSSSS